MEMLAALCVVACMTGLACNRPFQIRSNSCLVNSRALQRRALKRWIGFRGVTSSRVVVGISCRSSRCSSHRSSRRVVVGSSPRNSHRVVVGSSRPVNVPAASPCVDGSLFVDPPKISNTDSCPSGRNLFNPRMS